MTEPKKIIDLFKQTKIWKTFTSETLTKHQRTQEYSMVEKLVNDAISILDGIVETFPTYTLHNGQHQLNILNLYGKLLGERINDLSSLECAILILSAFYHDLGMVFKKEERANLKDEEYFQDFLSQNNKAKLDYEESSKTIDENLAEWYCRWSHAKRVWQYLEPLDSQLEWDETNIRCELANVCLSHNENVEWIKNEPSLETDFWNEADLKFCAILLRLADVLDFDDTRSPKSTYEFLGLDNPKSHSEKISQTEFQKHMASKGFFFNNWSADKEYELNFKASPEHPTIEQEIYKFLDYIQTEFEACKTSLNFCSERWKNFKLPSIINRNQVRSTGYTFGEFKFTLDSKQVLDLLMGDNLYKEKFVCIRELLQNAIDTSRYREFYERSRGNSDYKAQPIEVSDWEDEDGYTWIRIDDYGMGMTEYQILNYFLKVGNSYYNSDEFKVEKLKFKNKTDFTPISRFGVGILSCFIVADRVEVNTKSIQNESDASINPIRLSLEGMNDYYIMQTGKNIPAKMPNKQQNVEKYRSKPGTSLALRIKPSEDLAFDLKYTLEKTLFNPPVDVLYEHQKIGFYFQNVRNNPIKPITYKLNEKEIEQLKTGIINANNLDFQPEIEVVPIDLEKQFKHPLIKGYLVVYNIYTNDTFDLSKQNNKFRFSLKLEKNENGIPEMSLQLQDGAYSHRIYSKIELNSLYPDNFDPIEKYTNRGIYFSHNGISIGRHLDTKLYINNKNTPNSDSFVLGYVELSDELRPELSISRDEIKKFPWIVWSQVNYTIRKNIPEGYENLLKIDYLIRKSYTSTINELNKDKYLVDLSYWGSENIFEKISNDNPKTTKLISLIDILNCEESINYRINQTNLNRKKLCRKLIDIHGHERIKIYRVKILDTILDTVDYKRTFIKHLETTLNNFPPLFFCEYENYDGIHPEANSSIGYNLKHPFCIWLKDNYSALEKYFPSHLKILVSSRDHILMNNILEKLTPHFEKMSIASPDFIITENDFRLHKNNLPIKKIEYSHEEFQIILDEIQKLPGGRQKQDLELLLIKTLKNS